ncbi:hypothetical protein ACFV2H_05865 [Streptomyces sp. NPDC059629]
MPVDLRGHRRVPDAALGQVHPSGITPALSDDCEALADDGSWNRR